MDRATALQHRKTLGDSLFYLTKAPGWIDFKKILEEHVARYRKMADNPKFTDENRLRALAKVTALSDLLQDIEIRISEGTEAEKLLVK